MKIILIIAARPNFMKAFPVYNVLKKDFDLTLIHTGQHFDTKMSKIFFEELKFPKPDIHLTLEKKTKAGDFDNKLYIENNEYLQDKDKVIDELLNYKGNLGQLGEIKDKLKIEFEKINPELVIVFGDVTSTLSSALVCKNLNIKLVHVESGLRSGDLKMPEEVNRILTDHLTDFYFVTEQSGIDNLKNTGITENIFLVGNTMIDTQQKYLSDSIKTKYNEKIGLKNKKYVLVTVHRPSNVDNLEKLKEIFDDLIELSKTESIVYPGHYRTKTNLKKIKYLEKVNNNKNIILSEPLGYLEFTCLLYNCKYLITDSGGLQEESTSLEIPCFTLRDNTERPCTFIENNGTNQLIKKINEIKLKEKNKGKNNMKDLWDGRTSERICNILKNNNQKSLYISSGCNLNYLYTFTKDNFKKIYYTYQESSGVSMIDDIMNNESEFYKNDYDIYLLCIGDKLRNDLIYPLVCETEYNYEEIYNNLITLYENCIEKVIKNKEDKIVFLNVYPINVFNNSMFSYKYSNSNIIKYYYLYKAKIYELCEKNKNLFVLDFDYLFTNLKIDNDLIIRKEMFGSHPEYDGSKYLGTLFINKLNAILNKKKIKCIVVDLDNTLWKGVFREGDYETELIHRHRKLILNKMYKNGIIICVCSKNDESDKEEIIKYLKLDDIVMKYFVNWEQKSKNILNISKELNIGLESIAFFDDNSFERDEVKTNLPQVNVYKETDIENILNLPEFNDYNISKEGKNRNETYKTNEKRNENDKVISLKYDNYSDYLKTLNFKISFNKVAIGDFSEIDRISELVHRTNQQNITLKRYSTQELKDIIKNNDSNIITIKLCDKFGDYGMIGVIIMEDDLIMEFAISCRALGKQVEECLFTFINNINIEKYKKIKIECKRTEKNSSFFDKFINFGFYEEGKYYILKTETKLEYPNHFKVIF
jgi:UDP-N-acetylglucosamine 2-epimerase (non-hydrolysing)